ncbi:MAG: hypothetical protein Kow0059_08720 [Candidatus Sumerlaeia bacterium]
MRRRDWTTLALRCLLVMVLSAAAGTGFNLLYPRGINPFRVLPPPSPSRQTPDLSSPATEQAAPSEFPLIGIEEAYRLFQEGGAIFLDARHDPEYRRGHIPGAFHLPPYAFEKGRPDALDFLPHEGVEIVLYCNGPDCPLAEETARFLTEYDYRNFVIFHGGWEEWAAHQYPAESSR